MKSSLHLLCFSSVARQTDPEAAAEDLQLDALSDSDRPEGAGSSWRNLRHHRPRGPHQSGPAQCEGTACRAVINLHSPSCPDVFSLKPVLSCACPSISQHWGLQRRDTSSQRGRPSTRTTTSGAPTSPSTAGPPSSIPGLWEPGAASTTARCRTSLTGSKGTRRTIWRPAGGDSPSSSTGPQTRRHWPCPLSLSAVTMPGKNGNRWILTRGVFNDSHQYQYSHIRAAQRL